MKMTLVLLVASNLIVLASSPSALAYPPPDPESAEKGWLDLLSGDSIFGDYVDAQLDEQALKNARQFVYVFHQRGTAKDAGPLQRRLAARSLWVGINLEYQAMLLAVPDEERQDHAWRTMALTRELRKLLEGHSLSEFEEKMTDRAFWQQAFLRLDAMEKEAGQLVPASAPSLREQVREALLAEFSPFNGASQGINVLMMKQVSNLFRDCEALGKEAGSIAKMG